MKKNIFRTRIAAIILLVLATAALTNGCGRSSGASKKQIRKDVEMNMSEINTYGLKVDSVDIDRRQTSAKDKRDAIWATVNAHNEYCTYTASCEIFYGLYNDGWLLDSIGATSDELLPKISAEDFPQATADSAVEEMGYKEYWLDERNEDTDSIRFKYGAYDTDGTEMVISMDYEFAPDRGWYQFTSSGISANAFGW